MIVTSGSSSSIKKMDSAMLNTIMMRTDGFKNVFRGFSHKHNQPSHQGTHTSIGKRTPAKEYHLTKDSESRLYGEFDRSTHLRRNQTA